MRIKNQDYLRYYRVVAKKEIGKPLENTAANHLCEENLDTTPITENSAVTVSEKSPEQFVEELSKDMADEFLKTTDTADDLR